MGFHMPKLNHDSRRINYHQAACNGPRTRHNGAREAYFSGLGLPHVQTDNQR